MAELKRTTVSFPGPLHPVKAYLSRPASEEKFPGLILIHEIWGLVPHIENVADRFAAEGFAVVAPDLMGSDPKLAPVFVPETVTSVMRFMSTLQPGRARDPGYQQSELTKLPEEERAKVGQFYSVAFGGGLPYARFVDELVAAHGYLASMPFTNPERIGSLGFCFGGGMSAKLACTGKTQACVVFYGPNPDPVELVEKMNCPFSGHYGGEDAGLNATLDKLVAALVKHKKDFEIKVYPGAPHAFFNDTRPSYREAAAKEAWARSLAFLNRCLKQS